MGRCLHGDEGLVLRRSQRLSRAKRRRRRRPPRGDDRVSGRKFPRRSSRPNRDAAHSRPRRAHVPYPSRACSAPEPRTAFPKVHGASPLVQSDAARLPTRIAGPHSSDPECPRAAYPGHLPFKETPNGLSGLAARASAAAASRCHRSATSRIRFRRQAAASMSTMSGAFWLDHHLNETDPGGLTEARNVENSSL